MAPSRSGTRTLWSALVLALVLAPSPGTARAQGELATPASPAWPEDLLAAVNRERQSLGLAAVRPSGLLARAAQAHVDDMAKHGYFAFTGPSGAPTIESLVLAAGYQFGLLTEKLVRTPKSQNAAALAAGWRAALTANRSSLFHADVREIGVGVVETGEQWTIALVLATPLGPLGADGDEIAAFAALAREPARERTAFYLAIDARRRAWQLAPLRTDSVLEDAASRHAQALLAALVAGRPIGEVGSLADVVAQRDARWGSAGEITPGAVSRQRRSSHRGSNVGNSIGQVIVNDAPTAAMALEAALQQTPSDLREARFRVAGVGLAVTAVEPSGSGLHCVWVLALATR